MSLIFQKGGGVPVLSARRIIMTKEKSEAQKFSLDDLSEKLAEMAPKKAAPVIRVMVSVSVGIIVFSALARVNLWIPAMFIFLASLIWFLFMKDFLDESPKSSLVRWLKVEFVLFFAALGLTPYCASAKFIKSSAAFMLGFACVAAMIGIAIMLVTCESGKKVLEWLDTKVHIPFASTENNELKPGDIVLCNVKEKIENGDADCREILPSKDRFLHMLILGPTGCGKTSQIILPMCHQDILNLESGLTVLEPKGDLAREVAMMAKDLGRDYLYFDPSVDNCPFFNPLIGDETDVIENAVTTFLALSPDSPQYFKDLSEQLVRNTLKVLKRLDKTEGIDGKYSTFIWMSRVLQNNGGQGRELVQKFSKLPGATQDEAKENADIASWFLNEYFAERSKIYENSSGIRAQVTKVISNHYLRHILNPDVEKGEYNQLDFDKHLEDGGVICISTAQGLLRDLGKFLGYFLILQFKSAVFRRPGNEDTRRSHWLYIDEFQEYSTPGFSQMLTQGRSYRVACHLATQARAQMAMGGGRDGKNFVELVSTNARNIVIFPGISKDDAKFYSEQFGEIEKTEKVEGYTKKVFNPLTGGLSPLGHPSVQIREQTKLTAKYTATDLIYRPFGEIVYCLIKKNSIQLPQAGVVKWLDKEYDARLKKMIDDEIVTHELGREGQKTIPDTNIISDDGWGDEEGKSEPPTCPAPPDVPSPTPAREKPTGPESLPMNEAPVFEDETPNINPLEDIPILEDTPSASETDPHLGSDDLFDVMEDDDLI